MFPKTDVIIKIVVFIIFSLRFLACSKLLILCFQTCSELLIMRFQYFISF